MVNVAGAALEIGTPSGPAGPPDPVFSDGTQDPGFRPATFDDVVGQTAAVASLRLAANAARVRLAGISVGSFRDVYELALLRVGAIVATPRGIMSTEASDAGTPRSIPGRRS